MPSRRLVNSRVQVAGSRGRNSVLRVGGRHGRSNWRGELASVSLDRAAAGLVTGVGIGSGADVCACVAGMSDLTGAGIARTVRSAVANVVRRDGVVVFRSGEAERTVTAPICDPTRDIGTWSAV